MSDNNRYNGGISKETVNSPAYQAELKKLRAHYGIRATLKSYEQAAWDKEGAYARLDQCNETWLRIEAAKDIIGAEFAFKVHELLAVGNTDNFGGLPPALCKYLYAASNTSRIKANTSFLTPKRF